MVRGFKINDSAPPVVILGGQENALSVTRSFGRRGIPVYVSATAECTARHSKYCMKWLEIPDRTLSEEYWRELFLGDEIELIPSGSVVLSCSDEAVAFVAQNKAQLSENFILEINEPKLQTAMLDKQRTFALAKEAGILAPAYALVRSERDIERVLHEFEFPLLLKPIHTHIMFREFGKKMFLCNDIGELRDLAETVIKANIPFMINEYIPGPDSQLAGYHTYIDSAGIRRFEFTKKVLRRYPYHFGSGCNHTTQYIPEVVALGRRFFDAIGYRGIGNLEFKFDERDGEWKLIECNPRFTAIQELIRRSGLETSQLLYCDLIGKEFPMPDKFREGISLVHIVSDFKAYRQLREEQRLTLFDWLSSVPPAYVRPFFSWTDMRPARKLFRARIEKRIRNKQRLITKMTK